LLTLTLFALGLMAKPMIVTFPFVLLLLDFWPLGRVSFGDGRERAQQISAIKRLILEKVPFFALTLASSVWTFVSQHGAGATSTLRDLPLLNRIANALIAYLRYAIHLLWPSNLCIYYPHPGAWPFWRIVVAAVVLATLTGGVVVQKSRRPFMSVGWLWFLGTLVPVIGVVQVGSQSIADRYTYIPSVGFFILLVWTVGSFMKSSRMIRSVSGSAATVALGACCVMARIQVGYWKDSKALFSHALDVTPENYMAHFCVGNALIAEGKIPEGREHLRQSAEINPSFASAHGALGVLAGQAGDFKGAIRQYEEALHYQPDSAGALNNLAWLYATCPDPAQRNGPEAVSLALRACSLTQYGKALLVGTLAAAYAEAGRFDQAVETAERARQVALEWNQSDVAARNAELMKLYKAGSAFHETLKHD
jgi:Flp pilus assembly protein TadD